MGNQCFGFRTRLLQRLRPLPALLVVRGAPPQGQGKDYHVAVLGAAGLAKGALVRRWVRGGFQDACLPGAEGAGGAEGAEGGARGAQAADPPRAPRAPRARRALLRRLAAGAPAFPPACAASEKQILEELQPFYELLCKVKGKNVRQYPIVLVLGSRGEQGRWELTIREGVACVEWDCAFLETSAAMGVGVQELLHALRRHERRPGPAAPPAPPARRGARLAKAAEKLLGHCLVL
ncbi:GTP-binding protein Di-Ras3 [Canis lupus dingo]|uniref:GTP-binding protein Di-Ras3 n=1 Tax=Canis lupus dingo TaxID=286419 RepID=UPI0020C24C31|nr:GTP-binding protein Di-Ras3 [Canis lupus dingo]